MEPPPSPARRRDPYWLLAWLCVVLAIPLRLYYFAGFGLGDDGNESLSLIYFAERLRLNPQDFLHYRLVNMLIRGLAYRFFSVSEMSFILPILVFALGTHAVSLLLARDLFGSRAAFLTSLLFLVTPYETLASTANVPDYFHALFFVACAWSAYRGHLERSPRLMALAALFLFLGVLNRLFALLLLPVFGLLTLVTLGRWRGWLAFWGTLATLVALLCLADYFYSGSPYRWLVYNSFGGVGGIDVTNIVGLVLMTYPRYLFFRDDFGNWMFGITGWCGALGALLALGRLITRRAGPAEVLLVLAFFVFGGLFEFMPHKLTLHAYYSHPRIFRYLAQISPVVYLCGGYFLEQLCRSRWTVGVGVLAAAAVALVGIQQTPRVAEPLHDANRDGRRLVAYLRATASDGPTDLYTDFWRVDRIRAQYHRGYLVWNLHGVTPDSKQEKVDFLKGVRRGLVVTGGATLPWYSGLDLIISLSRLDFAVPDNWTLVEQFDGKVTQWRAEPLRIWSVHPAAPEPAGGS